MFHDRFIKKEDPQVDLVLEQTRFGSLKWKNTGFSEPSWGCWKIGFAADNGKSEFTLAKEHLLTTGGWITEVQSLLKIKDKNNGQESIHVYRSHDDYVECLYESGYPGVSSLSRFLIDQFRPSMQLHWSVM